MNRKTFTRRQFLRLAGITFGACGLTCLGITALSLGEETPEHPLTVGFPEYTMGNNPMNEKILVAYASAAGSTGGVAEVIGSTLSENGAAVDVRPVQSVASLDGYRGVVLGSAIHGGKWLPEAVDFLKLHQAALRQVPTAFFLVGMMAASKSESNRNLVAQYLTDQRELVSPVAEGRFVGAMFLDQWPFFTALGMRFFLAYCGVGLRGGDYRDPQAIRAWAQEVYPLLG